ncbi:3-oxoacyl-[acyl-carrier protein] reductase [Amorphus suaedae]
MATKKLQGKIALVTGASRGIGRSIAEHLAAEGAFVAIHYNAADASAKATLAAVEAAGGTGAIIQGDLMDPATPRLLSERFLDLVEERFGTRAFDILVNNAGIGGRNVIEEVDEETFDATLTVDLRAPFFLIRYLSPFLRDGGRIINISSMASRAAFPFMAVYTPAKAGLDALAGVLANHFGPRGITVNSVLPGATATELNPATHDPEKRRATEQTIALGRLGEPEDIARIVAFLASDEGGWVTGQRIDASGGQRL